MTEENKSMVVQEQEMVETEGAERMSRRATFIPRSDIYETDENIVIMVDMPGAREEFIDITIEKDILMINGTSTHGAPDGYDLVFAEFEAGNYERNFRLTDHINRDGIEAVFMDGVLKLTLPKAEEAKVRKIVVKSD